MPNVIHKTTARGQWYDGIYFRSVAELERYRTLKERERAGLIHDLETQPKFEIRHPETGEVACKYFGDFQYRTAGHNLVLEDVKGIRTDVYKLKVILVRVFCGIRITEVTAHPRVRNKTIVGYRWKINGVWEE